MKWFLLGGGVVLAIVVGLFRPGRPEGFFNPDYPPGAWRE